MSQPISLKDTERKAFQTFFSDGLIDIGVGCYLLVFAIAPLLEDTALGDWSSVLFLPFWLLVNAAIFLLKKRVVAPRIGSVTFGGFRRARLKRMKLFLMALLALGLILSFAVLFIPGVIPGDWTFPITLAAILFGFGILAAIYTDYPMFYLYALLAGAAPIIGELFYRNLGVSHHGYVVVFSVVCGLIILIGIVKLIHLLASTPAPGRNKMDTPGAAENKIKPLADLDQVIHAPARRWC